MHKDLRYKQDSALTGQKASENKQTPLEKAKYNSIQNLGVTSFCLVYGALVSLSCEFGEISFFHIYYMKNSHHN